MHTDSSFPHPSVSPTPSSYPAASSVAAPLVSARGLTKSFGNAFALNGVDLDVRGGEALAIMGASGSGKSTLLHVLAGILPADSGTVMMSTRAGVVSLSLASEAVRSRLRREEMGFVFQQGMLLPELTAVENVALPLLLAGHDRRAAESRAAQWLAALGLGGMENRRIGQLSGGEAQRVAVARAQVAGASVIFADEPTGALDSATAHDVMSALLHTTLAQGSALVVVTHDQRVADRCTRTIHLRDGRVTVDRAASPASAATTVAPVRPGAER